MTGIDRRVADDTADLGEKKKKKKKNEIIGPPARRDQSSRLNLESARSVGGRAFP